jgi:hypothetical protein
MEWYEILISILTGIAACIPLVINLVKYVKKAIKEKNWGDLVELVTNLMKEAETKFDNGVERREWVLMCVKASADTIDYDIDLVAVGELIDSLCALTKVVNPPVAAEEVTE